MTVVPQPPESSDDVDLDSAVAALEGARRVTILCHVQPDADTIGSGLALAIALHRKGVQVCVSFDGLGPHNAAAPPPGLPASMLGFPGLEHLVPAADVPVETDLVVTVDCGSAGRVGALRDRFGGARRGVLVLDHHRSNTRFGTVNVVDAQAESTAGLITRLLDGWGVPIDEDIAHCLFAGLVTDTGSFRWVRTGTHALAERLLATGIDGPEIARTLLDTHPFGWLPMLSRVLGSARLVPETAGGAGLVYAVVRRDDAAGLRSEEVESVVDIVRTTAEADVAAVFKQAAGVDVWTVSLRARGGTDVAAIATALGGGGHKSAAGYTAHAPLDEAVTALITTLG
ncbi:MAG: bifunctional oligoribonuclease/PAP phosphatase NrnA [Mycobacteriaceae bacterium]|nr:bifunctional oligoribonuclease/PAP phosphatase NrnA [Mycobacteriaceae bacterium]